MRGDLARVVDDIETAHTVVLTGGIGSGKSSVGRILRQWGAHVVDADVLAREVVAPGGPGLAAVVAQFGQVVLSPDGSLDRSALAEKVFTEADRLNRLEAIIHPLVHQIAVERLAAGEGASLLVYEVPLPGRSPFAQEPAVIVVDASDEARRRRLAVRGLSEEQIAARMATQRTREEWLALADLVVSNSGSEADLEAEVARIWRELTGEAPPVRAAG